MRDSPRTDIELGARVTVEIEVPRWSFVKRQAGKGIEYVSPVPCPYNYGFVPGTLGEDGEPIDAIVLGPRVRRGTRVETCVVGRIAFLDAGIRDDKLICKDREPTLAERRGLSAFFGLYARARAVLNRLQRSSGRTEVLSVVFDRLADQG